MNTAFQSNIFDKIDERQWRKYRMVNDPTLLCSNYIARNTPFCQVIILFFVFFLLFRFAFPFNFIFDGNGFFISNKCQFDWKP